MAVPFQLALVLREEKAPLALSNRPPFLGEESYLDDVPVCSLLHTVTSQDALLLKPELLVYLQDASIEVEDLAR